MLQSIQIQCKKCFDAGTQDAVSLYKRRINFFIRARGMCRVFYAPVAAQHWAEVERASFSRRTGTNGDNYIGRGGKIFPGFADVPCQWACCPRSWHANQLEQDD